MGEREDPASAAMVAEDGDVSCEKGEADDEEVEDGDDMSAL